MSLDYFELRKFAETSAAVTLLRGDSFVEDIAFLNRTFRGGGSVIIPDSELRSSLARWLENTFDSNPINRPLWEPASRIAFYVKQQFLRKREPADRTEPTYELTSDVDRLLSWIEDQRRREFVGTEYGLQAILRDLRVLSAHASGDIDQRLANLKAQKAEIQRQIDELSDNPEKAAVVDGRFVIETVQRLERASQDLVSDFSLLRERFTDIARDIAREQGTGVRRRGDYLRLALDGEDALRKTPMGESFYGFWRMVATSERDEFIAMVRRIYATPAIPADMRQRRVLLGLLDRLREQGQVVLDANRQLTRHVRRALDREEIETRRLMAARVHEFQVLLLGHPEQLADLAGISIDERIPLGLAMERPLYEPPEPVMVDTILRAGEQADIREAARQIAAAGVVDIRRLVIQLDAEIEELARVGMQGVLLSSFVMKNPPKAGVIDLLGFLHIAHGLEGEAEILPHKPFEWQVNAQRRVVCPDVFFLSVKKLVR